ncbi:MAG: MFS transporter [Actinomycetota bacterium]|nr:MFS transporter [Actinomycetota bacterium]
MGSTKERFGALLESRDFRLLLGAQFLGQAADGMAQAVFADILVLEPLNAGTPWVVFKLFALTLLPYSALSPFLGVFVDRWSRRSLVVWTNLVRGALLLTIPLWRHAFPGHIALYIAVLLLLGLGRLFLTTKGALLPVVLHESHLLPGNSISGGGGMISALLGGALGIELIKFLTEHEAFAIAGAMYLSAASLGWWLSAPFAHRAAHTIGNALGRVARGLHEGLRAIWGRPGARLPLIAIFILRMLGIAVVIVALLVIKKEFPHQTEAAHSGRLNSATFALAMAGVGAFVGALTAPRLGRRFSKAGLITLGFVLSGVGIALLGGIVSIPAVLALTFIGGFGGFVSKVAVDAQIQEALPDDYRGRAFALYDILYNVASVCAAAVILGFDGVVSFRPLLIMFGIVTLLVAAVMSRAMTRAGIAGSPLHSSAAAATASPD